MTKDYVKAAVWGMISGLAIVTLLIVGGNGCIPLKPGESPARANGRAAVLLIAKAIQASDKLCAQYALDTKEIDVAKKCASIYDQSRSVLLVAESGLDVWDLAAQNSVGCAVNKGIGALLQFTTVLNTEHLAVPTLVTDALQIAAGVNFGCVIIQDGGTDG